MGKALKRWWPLFMLPTCLAFMIGFVIPFIQGFYLSFCQFITINNAHFVGIENYVRALSDPQFSTSFFFTVAFAFLSTVLINVIALAIAQALTRKALKGTNIFRTIFFEQRSNRFSIHDPMDHTHICSVGDDHIRSGRGGQLRRLQLG